MADRNLVTYLEETGSLEGKKLTGCKLMIDRSAAGQPGIFITAQNALEEDTTVVVQDGLALFAPVLEWLLQEVPLNYEVAQKANITYQATRDVLHSLVQIGLDRRDADTTDDGSPVQVTVSATPEPNTGNWTQRRFLGIS